MEISLFFFMMISWNFLPLYCFLFFFHSFIYYFIEKTLPSLLYFILSHSLAWWKMYLHDFFFYYKKLKHLFLLSRLKNIQLVVSFSYHNYYNLKPFTIYTAGHLGVEFYYPKILVYPEKESAAHHRILSSFPSLTLIICFKKQ